MIFVRFIVKVFSSDGNRIAPFFPKKIASTYRIETHKKITSQN